MPAQARVLGEGLSRRLGERELRPERSVLGVAAREEDGHRVCSSVEEDGDENPAGRGRGSLRNALVEQVEAQLARAVNPEREPCASCEERSSVEAGAGGERHARLDRRQTATRLGDSAAHEV